MNYVRVRSQVLRKDIRLKMKLNYKRTALVGLAFMTISAFWQLYNNEVPLMLEELVGKDKQFLINIIMSLDNILSLFLLPLFGDLSDKTSTRLGKRMPYIVAGTVLSVMFMVCIPLAYKARLSWFFFIAVGGVLLSTALYRSPAVALMPDVTPKPLRSQGNAVINLMGAVGIIFVNVITPMLKGKDNYGVMFMTVAVFIFVSIAVMTITVKENKWVALMPPDVETEEERMIRENKGKKIKGSVRKSLIFLLFSVFLWYMAYSAIETNYSRYAQEIWELSNGEYTKPMLFGSIAALISFVPIGMASKKLGRRKMVLVALGVLLSVVFAMSFITWYTPYLYVLFALVGISWAAINVNSYPMVVEMSHGADVGKYTGLYYTFSMAAQIATPVITGFLFDLLGGLDILFPYATLFLFIAVITMVFVRHGDAHLEDLEKTENKAQ